MFSSNTTHSGLVNYIEDVFSTYLYTGTGASQTGAFDVSTGFHQSAPDLQAMVYQCARANFDVLQAGVKHATGLGKIPQHNPA